jgi:hypothetical protein
MFGKLWNPGDIDILEMHFTNKPLWHFSEWFLSSHSFSRTNCAPKSIYKNRNPQDELTGLDARKWGRCFPYPNDSYDCYRGIVRDQGVRKMRCLLEATSDQINAAVRRGD